MKILIISASQRLESKSIEVSKYISSNLLNSNEENISSILDISKYPILLEHYGGNTFDKELLDNCKENVLRELYSSDAFIFVVPEWGGMIPPALVNLFLLAANGSANGLPLGHKPGLILGISASGGGHNPISLVKGYAAKNTHITWLSLHTVINNVNEFLAVKWSPESDNRFSQIQSRLKIGVKCLGIYGKKLKAVREELIKLTKVHPYGQ